MPTQNLQPINPNDKWIVDEDGKVIGVQTRNNPTPRMTVVSADAPVDADGRPDGTIYIQTAA